MIPKPERDPSGFIKCEECTLENEGDLTLCETAPLGGHTEPWLTQWVCESCIDPTMKPVHLP